ncbi:MAG: HRDC domain-containing protein [Phycisphaerae bacterium]|nr:HRDC domain-containing protein [Phycisphaerae bacterium]
MTFRRRQRSKQHHAAHAGGSDAHAPPFDHPHVPAGDAVLVTTPQDLDEFIEHARTTGAFAFDTEFIGEVAYFPKTCLIQLSTRERIALVDPVAVGDLQSVWMLVGDPEVTTIVHAGASDLSPVRRALQREPENIVDVQVAAGFTGMAYPSSLSKLVDRYLAFPLAKGHTFTDWDARPLSESQLRYAADDVRYLPLIWDLLRAELEQRGRVQWAVQETRHRLGNPHAFDAKSHARRASRGYDLDASQEALLLALCVARDTIAQLEDVPHRSTIPDAALLEIVRARCSTKAELCALRGMPRPIVARHGDLLLETIGVHPSTQVDWFAVRRRREDAPEIRAKIDAMLLESQRLCEAIGVAQTLAVTRADLERYVRRALAAAERDEPAPPLFAETDWRLAAFGDAIERAEPAVGRPVEPAADPSLRGIVELENPHEEAENA